MTAHATPVPILWHLGVSHYSEKVRWALAYKGVEHERRTAPPGPRYARRSGSPAGRR